jgi:DNA polymerase bacteriophage-type
MTFAVPPPPPAAHMLPLGTQLVAGLGTSTVLADMDFETYSQAGYVWNAERQKWDQPEGLSTQLRGLKAVGASVYTEDPTCEILSFFYDLKDGRGARFWRPGLPNPQDLFDYLRAGGLIEAHNRSFERWVWLNVCIPRHGWPPIAPRQWRCSMAKARAHAMPGKLEEISKVFDLTFKKDSEGTRLLNKFSKPQKPTKKAPKTRILLSDDPVDAEKLFAYNERDIQAEAEASSLAPDLTGEELEFWFLDQDINERGIRVDLPSVDGAIQILRTVFTRYDSEICRITNGAVQRGSQLARLKKWLGTQGVHVYGSMDEDALDELLKTQLPPVARRALELRGLTGSASVKKVFAMRHRANRLERLTDLFVYYGARTGRFTGAAVQPTNFPNSGPDVWQCGCNRWSPWLHVRCSWCARVRGPDPKLKKEWNVEAAEDALECIQTGNLDLLELMWGDALSTISACLRAMLIAADDAELMGSDFSAIEAVVLAELAGEQWRIDVFRTHGKIYEMSASEICGIPFEEFLEYKKRTGNHHPMRKKVGKIAELALGYQGWVPAWKQFDEEGTLSDEEIKQTILKWRRKSPQIVEFWGGQFRRDGRYMIPEYYGVEGAAIQAILNPGREFSYRGIVYFMRGDAMYCRLLSGRHLVYHRPRLNPSDRHDGYEMTYEGWNTNPKNGPTQQWIRMKTYGGRLTENIVQATSRDILRYAMLQLAKAGYAIVLHVYDEIVAEVKKGYGSVEHFEGIMATMPAWCQGWPVRARDGWRGKRFRK